MTENENTSAESSDQELSDAVEEALAEATVVVDDVTTLTADLQRLQAEYSNYRKRVERDRAIAHEFSISLVVLELLPVLDDIERASSHGELTGGFKAVADQLEAITTKLGLTKFEEINIPFYPMIHEALMHNTSPDVTETTATQVLRPGYKFRDKTIRTAQVAVTDPEN
jgi:molecular chaperone GrpE